jgi:hypothetical protein
MIRSLLAGLLALFLGAPLMGSQAVEDEVARYRDQVAKAERAYAEGLAKERARAITTLTGSAKRAARNEPAAADELWRLVLQLDDMNADAREYFTANGKLNAVLAEVAKRKGPLIGDAQVAVIKKSEPRVDMSGAKTIRVTASVSAGYTLGSFKQGSTLIFQYVSGAWSGNNEAGEASRNQSPDDAKTDPGNRMQLFIDSGNEPVILAEIPPGTAAKPFVYTVDRDVVGLSLRIVNRRGIRNLNGGGGGAGGGLNFVSSYTGDVKYLVRIIK